MGAQPSAMDEAVGMEPVKEANGGLFAGGLQQLGMCRKNSLVKTTVSITCVGVGFGVALMMLFMICAFSNCWWPMFTFIVYVMTPIPLSFMMASCGNRDVEGSDPMESGGNSAFFKRIMAEFGTCLSGALFSTLIGLPITLMHNDVGQMGTTNWWVGMVWIFANLIVMVSLMVAVVSIRAPSGSSSY